MAERPRNSFPGPSRGHAHPTFASERPGPPNPNRFNLYRFGSPPPELPYWRQNSPTGRAHPRANSSSWDRSHEQDSAQQPPAFEPSASWRQAHQEERPDFTDARYPQDGSDGYHVADYGESAHEQSYSRDGAPPGYYGEENYSESPYSGYHPERYPRYAPPYESGAPTWDPTFAHKRHRSMSHGQARAPVWRSPPAPGFPGRGRTSSFGSPARTPSLAPPNPNRTWEPVNVRPPAPAQVAPVPPGIPRKRQRSSSPVDSDASRSNTHESVFTPNMRSQFSRNPPISQTNIFPPAPGAAARNVSPFAAQRHIPISPASVPDLRKPDISSPVPAWKSGYPPASPEQTLNKPARAFSLSESRPKAPSDNFVEPIGGAVKRRWGQPQQPKDTVTLHDKSPKHVYAGEVQSNAFVQPGLLKENKQGRVTPQARPPSGGLRDGNPSPTNRPSAAQQTEDGPSISDNATAGQPQAYVRPIKHLADPQPTTSEEPTSVPPNRPFPTAAGPKTPPRESTDSFLPTRSPPDNVSVDSPVPVESNVLEPTTATSIVQSSTPGDITSVVTQDREENNSIKPKEPVTPPREPLQDDLQHVVEPTQDEAIDGEPITPQEALPLIIWRRKQAEAGMEEVLDAEIRGPVIYNNRAVVQATQPRQYTGKVDSVDETNERLSANIESVEALDLRSTLATVFLQRKDALEEKVRRLRDEYMDLHLKWVAQCTELESGAKLPPPPEEPVSAAAGAVAAPSGRTTRRSTALGDAVRSDLELEQLIASLGTEELTDPIFLAQKNVAKIPDMISVKHGQVDFTFDDTNNLVEDPVTFYAPRTGFDDWTDDEKEIFNARFAATPKAFGFIADGLPQKNINQCVAYYYLHKKKHVDFRKVIATYASSKRGRGGRGVGKGKGNALLADIRQHDDEVSVRRTRARKPLLAPEPLPRTQEGSTTPTPEPEGRSRRRRPMPTPKAIASALQQEAEEEEEEEVEAKPARRGRKPGRKPKAPPSTGPPPLVEPVVSTKWPEEDHDLFVKLLAQHGDDFKRISASMPNRTTVQVTTYYKSDLPTFEPIAAKAPRRSTTPVTTPEAQSRGKTPPASTPWPAPEPSFGTLDVGIRAFHHFQTPGSSDKAPRYVETPMATPHDSAPPMQIMPPPFMTAGTMPYSAYGAGPPMNMINALNMLQNSRPGVYPFPMAPPHSRPPPTFPGPHGGMLPMNGAGGMPWPMPPRTPGFTMPPSGTSPPPLMNGQWPPKWG